MDLNRFSLLRLAVPVIVIAAIIGAAAYLWTKVHPLAGFFLVAIAITPLSLYLMTR